MSVTKSPVDLVVEEAEALAVHLGYRWPDDQEWVRSSVDPAMTPLPEIASVHSSPAAHPDEIQVIHFDGGTWFHR